MNFTDLTTKCSAKDLVAMLNEIYGRFDGIARVGNSQRIDSFCYSSTERRARVHLFNTTLSFNIIFTQVGNKRENKPWENVDWQPCLHAIQPSLRNVYSTPPLSLSLSLKCRKKEKNKYLYSLMLLLEIRHRTCNVRIKIPQDIPFVLFIIVRQKQNRLICSWTQGWPIKVDQ